MHEKTYPEISVVIATYNRPDFLRKFFENLNKLNTITKPRHEIIVVENCRDLAVAAITKEICDSFEVAFYHQPGLGRPHACNKGIAEARGEFIAFTDDDCIITDPNWLEKMLAVFREHPKVGYVSGKVTSTETINDAQKLWEAKGGLSKGNEDKYWSSEFLHQKKFRVFPWPFHKMCAGANFMVPAAVFKEVGLLNTALGEESGLRHGYTLEIGYRIASAGYELYYASNAEIFHFHPTNENSIKAKLYVYGKGDTGYPMSIFLNFSDFRYLWWALVGHAGYTMKKMYLSMKGEYPLPVSFVLNGLKGNLVGWAIAISDHLKIHSRLRRNQYDGFTTLKQDKKSKADRL